MKDNLYSLLKNGTFKKIEGSMDYKIEEANEPEITLGIVFGLTLLFLICSGNSIKILKFVEEIIK